jgi:exonuclease III
LHYTVQEGLAYFLGSSKIKVLNQSMYTGNDIGELSFASINCNSLNMSDHTKNLQKNKIYGIAKLKKDIIFLSDIRLSSKNKVSSSHDISIAFRTNPYCSYNFFFNSTQNKRGVGILIKSDITFTEENRIADPEENFLLLMGDIKGNRMIIGSIYGPNHNCEAFFVNLKISLNRLGDSATILGGDWNCTVSTDIARDNIDCLNMLQSPNQKHSQLLNKLCDECNLSDPYRALYPYRKDFTFCPRSVTSVNKSRIDFFIISNTIIPNVSECEIMPGLQSKLFDHKAIVLELNKKKIKKGGTYISNSILNLEESKLIVWTAVLECYIHNVNPAGFAHFDRPRLLGTIGEVWQTLRTIGPPFKSLPPFVYSQAEIESRNIKLVRISNALAGLNLTDFQNMPLSVGADFFLETLVSSVKNELGSFQHFYHAEKSAYKKGLINEINNLKSGENTDELKIADLERKLNFCLDEELKAEIEKFKLFENLNCEKITPYFLKLAKASSTSAKLTDIRDNDGNLFSNDEDRNEFIVSYYERAYRVPENFPATEIGCIEKFLGNDLCQNPCILNSKLTDHESESLEGNLSLKELDDAVSNSKIRSAPGIDGINNAFIKKFWEFFRVPTHNYAVKCFETGSFTPTFSTGSIRLIPKKGDCSKIKNWRPMSLLNCFYKIISRAINVRLQRASVRILSRAQKGFTSDRYIQEVLINVIENIAYCNKFNLPGSVVAIDEAKAFDSLNHGFMKETWKFFGFGQQMIRMLDTITNNRTSCIILGNNEYSRNFRIETGAMQGDSPSPLIFDFNQQILIFKLEFDPKIGSAFVNSLVPRPLQNFQDNLDPDPAPLLGPGPPDPVLQPVIRPLQNFQDNLDPAPDPAPLLGPGPRDPVPQPVIRALQAGNPHKINQLANFPLLFPAADPYNYESNRETNKTDAYADDTTVCVRTDLQSINQLKCVLEDFGNISGLKCNFDKTNLMVVGNKNAYTNEIGSVGYNKVESIYLLGMELNADLSCLSTLHESTILKLRKIVNFWVRFRLSLPGRLNIAKTFLLSQVSYLGCIITPTDAQLTTITNIIDGFVKGNLNISRDRICREPSEGGLGMINTRDFIISQQVVWVKRAQLSTKDCWRYDLKRLCRGNCWTLSPIIIDKSRHPILYNIAVSYEFFLRKFISKDDNFNKSFILNNPVIRRSREDERKLTLSFFNQTPGLNPTVLATVRFSDLFENGSMKSLLDINENFNLGLNLLTYMRLGTSLTNFFRSLKRNRETDSTCLGVEHFLLRFKQDPDLLEKF